jgi:hypothetical protein
MQREKGREMQIMVALFLFLTEMTGALAPFSFLVIGNYANCRCFHRETSPM